MGGAGSTPIHKAAKDGNLVDLRIAVQNYGSRINDQEKDLGYSALHVAAWQGYDAIARELLARGADPNLLDKEGRTALHLAAQKGHGEVVRALLRTDGTNREIRDQTNRTAWEYCRSKHPKIAQMIGPPDLSYTVPPMPHSAAFPAAAPAAAPVPPPQPPPAPRPQAPSIYPTLPSSQVPTGASSATSPSTPPQQPPYPQYPQYPQYPPQQPQTQNQSGPEYPTLPGAYPYGQQQGPGGAQPTGAGAQRTSDFGAQRTSNYGAGGAEDGWTRAGAAGGASSYPSMSGGNAPDIAQPSAPPQPYTQPPQPQQPQQQSHQQQHQSKPQQSPLNWAADAAMQQLAKLRIGQQGQGGHKPPLAHLIDGIAAAAAALSGHHPQPQSQGQGHGSAWDPSRDSGLAQQGPETSWSEACRMYRYQDLVDATQNFAASNKIGKGGFGEVFKGILDGVPVAIKVMDVGPEAMQGVKELTSEINILSRLHHPHVVLLIGACPEKGLLVYELAEGGSLEDRLFNPRPEGPMLVWQDRVRIAAEVASALLYLHTATPSIVHMDIKPANILLDRTLRAKLGDVGLARLMGGPLPALQEGHQGHETSTTHDSQLVGTLAYVDPEYLQTGQFSPKSDVYALGMVMLQLLTGQEKRGVIGTVQEARANVLYFAYVLDKHAGAWPAAEAMAFADIALKCTNVSRHERPDLRTEVLPALLQLKGRAVALYDPPPPARTTPSGSLPSGGSAAGSAPASVINTLQGGVPAMFVCPITQDIMQDPVVAADGYTYEREAIAAWLSKASTSPLTNLPLPHSNLVPNMLVRSAIGDWKQQQPQSGRAR